jgi:FKBP-type peptidyl-prolyl cis-trans isomerase FklB
MATLRPSRSLVLLGATVMITACGSGSDGSGTASLETDEQKVSYGIGRNLGESFAERLDLDALRLGLEHALAEEDSPVPDAEMQAAMQRVSQAVQMEQQERQAALAEENREAGAAFLAENAEKEGVTTTESGLQYEVVEAGDGESPGPDSQVTVHYRGTLADGTEFDSSYGRGEPTSFNVSGVIPGFSEGVQLMSVGSTYRLYIPGELAYGPSGSPPSIGPNQLIIFDVELLAVE